MLLCYLFRLLRRFKCCSKLLFRCHTTLSSDTKLGKKASDVKIENQRLKTVTEGKCLVVVLFDELCTKDVERSKVRFFKRFFSLYNKIYCMNQKVLIYLFRLNVTSFFGVETWFMKLYTCDLRRGQTY